MKSGSQHGRIGWNLLVALAAAAAFFVNTRSAASADAAPPAAEPKADAASKSDAKPAEAAEKKEAKTDDKTEAAATEAKAELTPEQMFEGGEKTYNNWIEVGGGAMMVSGDKGSAEQRQQVNQGGFGGIEDLHFQQAIDKATTLTLDGHSIFGPEDYAVSLKVQREKVGYAKFGFEKFTTFYDSSGGYFAPGDLHFSPNSNAWELERGAIAFEAGLTLPNAPQVVFKYRHAYRDGEKDSTIWAPVQTAFGLRGLYPSWYKIDESSDTFQLDASYSYKATKFGAGIRYETGELDNDLRTVFRPQEPARRNLTDNQGTSFDMLSVHAWSETWIKKNLSLSTGFQFANLDNDFSGSRIYGDDFDLNYSPNTLNSLGYFDLNGGSHKHEYIANLNLMAVPVKNLTVVPSLRVQKEDWNAESSGVGTLSDFPGEFFTASSDRDFLEVRERVDIRYNGITNWVFFAGPEWTEGSGNLKERGGLSRVNDIGVAPVYADSDDTRFYQKYFAGIRWYPTATLTLDVGGYYKHNNYEWDHNFDSTPNEPGSPDRYPAFLTIQDFETYDGNVRVTLRPFARVTLVSRYEYQESTVTTTPDPESGLSETDSSDITRHIFAQNVSWTPWSRLTLQAGINYVFSQTETPTSEYTEVVLDAKNNYWTANFNAGFVIDDKTDLNLGYFYYRSDNYEGNPAVTLPLGAASEEHGITAAVVRRLSENLRLSLRYGYSHFDDEASGGNDSYEAHLVYSTLQYRF